MIGWYTATARVKAVDVKMSLCLASSEKFFAGFFTLLQTIQNAYKILSK